MFAWWFTQYGLICYAAIGLTIAAVSIAHKYDAELSHSRLTASSKQKKLGLLDYVLFPARSFLLARHFPTLTILVSPQVYFAATAVLWPAKLAINLVLLSAIAVHSLNQARKHQEPVSAGF